MIRWWLLGILAIPAAILKLWRYLHRKHDQENYDLNAQIFHTVTQTDPDYKLKVVQVIRDNDEDVVENGSESIDRSRQRFMNPVSKPRVSKASKEDAHSHPTELQQVRDDINKLHKLIAKQNEMIRESIINGCSEPKVMDEEQWVIESRLTRGQTDEKEKAANDTGSVEDVRKEQDNPAFGSRIEELRGYKSY